MRRLKGSFFLILSRTDSFVIFLMTLVLCILFVLGLQNGREALLALSFESIPLDSRIALSARTFFDVTSSFDTASRVLVALGSLAAAYNAALAYTYIRVRVTGILASGLYSGLGLVLALGGIGCAACGTVLLSLALGTAGFSWLIASLPYKGMEIGYVGLCILLIATYGLTRKVNTPGVC